MSGIRMCPSCNEPVSAEPTEISGANFCENCDEPLFWRPVKSDVPPQDPSTEERGRTVEPGRDGIWTHDRFPEKEGIRSDVYESCWNCEERNDPPSSGAVIQCRVCGATIPRPRATTPPLGVVASCSAADGTTARRSWEVPDKLLVAVGVVLVALVVALVVIMIIEG